MSEMGPASPAVKAEGIRRKATAKATVRSRQIRRKELPPGEKDTARGWIRHPSHCSCLSGDVWLVEVEIEEVPVQILYSELP